MRILFVVYGFMPHGLAGACVYHFELAKQLLAKGQSVVVCSRTCNEAYNINGIEVHPFRMKESFAKLADAVITVPSISGTIEHDNITAIQHTVQRVDHPHPRAKFIYCAEHLQGMYKGKSMVHRPMMRLTPADEPRKLTGPATIGFINNAVQKGGSYIEPIAKAFPDNLIKVIYFPSQMGDYFKPDLPNIEYTEWQLNNFAAMDGWYSWVDIMCLPSFSEGYSTVALECLAKAIPAVARPINGILEVLHTAGHYAESVPEFIDALRVRIMLQKAASIESFNRWKVVSKLNDIDKLITFIK